MNVKHVIKVLKLFKDWNIILKIKYVIIMIMYVKIVKRILRQNIILKDI